jgi:trimeric autotransporter adhesin
MNNLSVKISKGHQLKAVFNRGVKGADGKSAYEIAVENGFVGTQAEWIASLAGGAQAQIDWNEVDGGSAATVYQSSQVIDGGNA